MKLLLTSNGIKNINLEQSFLELIGHRRGVKIAYIPTAGDSIEWIPETEGGEKYVARLKESTSEEQIKTESWLRAYREKYEEKGHSVVFVDLKEEPAKVREILESVDVIEVGGGDVNWLLDWAKKSKLDTYLKDLLDKGVVYTGTSAGSMLLNPDIGFTWWGPEEKWKGTDHIGLGIVDFMFQPLHGETDESTVNKLIERKKHMQTLMDYPWKIYLVKDGQAVVIDGDTVEHIGDGVKRFI